MSTITPTTAPAIFRPPAPPLAFALAIFTSAFLLFAVQPLIGKYILPWFGGGAGVWTACMLFFQTLLVAGYAYAHASIRLLAPRRQAILHIALLVAALAILPIIPSDRWKPTESANPTFRILLALLATVGLPYFVLAATGPLLQAWHSRLHNGAAPYRLYALSNIGSLLALLGYPFLFEPALSRPAQARIWSWILAAFVCICTYCALRSSRAPLPQPEPADQTARSKIPLISRILWILLPACASVLFLAVTNTLCQDIAAMPFLWVFPLAIYLLSFILTFDSSRWYSRPLFALFLLLAETTIVCVFYRGTANVPIVLQIAIHGLALFVCCMICHGEVYRLRPDPRHLTSFYLLISVGGALGGLLVGIVAPRILFGYHELHIGMLACPVLLGLATFVDPASALSLGQRRPVWYALASAWVILAMFLYVHARGLEPGQHSVWRGRSFYGAMTVFDRTTGPESDRTRALQHGRTLHGLQFLEPQRHKEIHSYYGPKSGINLIILRLEDRNPRRIGIAGLGTATLAAAGRSTDTIRYYEIDPLVLTAAQKYFTFLADCPAHLQIILGDARLSLQREEPQNYDLLILDVFSGDAIPLHLLTREAFETYLRHLRPDGAIAVHISNRHINLAPALARLAEHFHLDARLVRSGVQANPATDYPSDWVVMTPNSKLLDDPIWHQAGQRLSTLPAVPLWTDDQASVLRLLK